MSAGAQIPARVTNVRTRPRVGRSTTGQIGPATAAPSTISGAASSAPPNVSGWSQMIAVAIPKSSPVKAHLRQPTLAVPRSASAIAETMSGTYNVVYVRNAAGVVMAVCTDRRDYAAGDAAISIGGKMRPCRPSICRTPACTSR